MDITAAKPSSTAVQNGSCHELKTASSHHPSSPAGEDCSTAQSANSTATTISAALTARSPFMSSLGERHTTSQSRSAQSPAQVQSMPPQWSGTERYTLPPDQTVSQAKQHSSNNSTDSLSSRGVLSHQQNSSTGTSGTSGSTTSSAFSSFDANSLDPLLNSAQPQPAMYHQQPTIITGHPPISGVTSVRPAAASVAGYSMHSQTLSANAGPISGSRLQGQANYFHPHLSQYQPVPHGTMALAYGGNYERVLPSGVQYQPQHMQTHHVSPPPSYSTQVPNGQLQTQYPHQYYNYHSTEGQSAATSGLYGAYPTQGQKYAYSHHQFQPTPQEAGPVPYQQNYPSHSTSSVGSSLTSVSSYSGSNYGYKYGGFTPNNSPYTPLPTHGRLTGNMPGYNIPQNGDAPASIAYHPLSNMSGSSSALLSRPVDITPHAGYRHNQVSGSAERPRSSSSPPQGQPLSAAHMIQPEPKPLINFSSMSSISTLPSSGESFPQSQVGRRFQQPYPANGAGVGDSTGGGSVVSEELLLSPLQKLDLKTHTRSEPPNSEFPPKPFQPAIAQLQKPHPSSSSYDSESTCSSYLSEAINSREEIDEKKQFQKHLSSLEILEHPKDSTVTLNGRVELRCKARLIDSKLEEQPNYLWYKDDEPLVGEISDECVLEGVGEGDGGRYFCLVSHPSGHSSQQTQTAVVTIRTGNDARAPVITHQPEAYVEAVKGEPLVLSITAEGEPPMSYRWFKGAQELKFCSGSALRVPSAGALDNGQYHCTVSNDYGSVLSDVMLVKVVLQRTVPPPAPHFSPSRKRYSSNPDDDIPSDHILRQYSLPVAQQTKNWARLALYLGLLPGDAAQYHQSRDEERAYHLLREWRDRKQGTLYALKTILSQAGVSLKEPTTQSSTHSTPSTLPSSLFSSQPASLSISSQPRDVVVVYGQEARLEARTERTEHLTKFQWYKNGHKLTGKTDKQLIIASTVDSDEGSYQCQISTPEGSVMSHSATIRVFSVPPESLRRPVPLRPAGNYGRERPRDIPHLNSGTTMYGLTGRGVDDDDETSLPVRASVPQEAQRKATDVGILQIVQHPQSQVVSAGSTVTLSCRASAGDHSQEITYVWFMNGLSLPEDTSPDYQILNVTEEDEGTYWCEVSYMTHSLTSKVATVSVEK